MELKGLGFAIANQPEKVDRSQKEIKTDMTSDRDSQGQQFSQQKEQERELSKEEVLEALQRLKKMPAIKDSLLNVQLKEVNNRLFVVILEPSGKVVRRFPAQELANLPPEEDNQSKGLLLSKKL